MAEGDVGNDVVTSELLVDLGVKLSACTRAVVCESSFQGALSPACGQPTKPHANLNPGGTVQTYRQEPGLSAPG